MAASAKSHALELKTPCVLIFFQMFVATNFCGHLYLAEKTGKVGSKTDL